MSNDSTSSSAQHDRFLSILVAATNAAMADMLSATLNACGHATAQVSQHVDGLRVMESFVFDVLVIASDNESGTSPAFAVAAKTKSPAVTIV